MQRLSLMVAALLLASVFLPAGPAQAQVVVHISKATQRMSVSVDGAQRYVWRISTGRAGFATPSGVFRPQMLARSWFSRKYYNSPMPYSIFYHKGYAIHGTNYLSRLGGPASHGCVRLHPANAAVLFSLVQRYRSATRIIVS
jgi:lipoprotein-anchoring transpeptidase ErfK/SrfK